MTTKTIYNSNTYDIYTDDDIRKMILDYRNDFDDDNKDVTDDDIFDERMFLSEQDFDDEYKYNLNKTLSNRILCIADLGLWHGRKTGYKLLGDNLNEILTIAQGDYYKVYYDGYNVRAEDNHHDGTNYYTFRVIKDNVNIDNLLNKLYNDTATNNDINNYTKSLKSEIKSIYGW